MWLIYLHSLISAPLLDADNSTCLLWFLRETFHFDTHEIEQDSIVLKTEGTPLDAYIHKNHY